MKGPREKLFMSTEIDFMKRKLLLVLCFLSLTRYDRVAETFFFISYNDRRFSTSVKNWVLTAALTQFFKIRT